MAFCDKSEYLQAMIWVCILKNDSFSLFSALQNEIVEKLSEDFKKIGRFKEENFYIFYSIVCIYIGYTYLFIHVV